MTAIRAQLHRSSIELPKPNVVILGLGENVRGRPARGIEVIDRGWANRRARVSARDRHHRRISARRKATTPQY
jgi:hypothetical protein